MVVSDTSPLTNLAAIGRLELLPRLFGRIAIAEAVWSELNAYGKRWPGSLEVENADWVERHPVKDKPLVTILRRDLDHGEAESIALALELKAEFVLLDEKEGRHAAQRLGLKVMGVIGILLLALARNEIEQLKPSLDALRQTAGFYLGESLYLASLERAVEKSKKDV